ncbi:MAG: hypothetical protein BMS9Abin02_0350 [Anaerolineae bacterium]|nr:MAG: hypothetical protein BMS9Abin02_0350 [Anaerolineae bacterium]
MENMLQKMMKRFPLFIAMGLMIVVVAVIIGAVTTANAADYYAIDKVTRETAQEWVNLRASVESTVIWLPYFKFLGVAMILAGITMALGVIAGKLELLGKQVMSSVPERARVAVPERPRSVMWMRMFLMLGMLVILVGFIVSLVTAGTAADLFSNPIPVIDSAPTGSALLNDLASVQSTETWLEAFKFVGVAFFFISIVNGLSTIIFALQYQKKAIPEVVQKLPAQPSLVPSPGD